MPLDRSKLTNEQKELLMKNRKIEETFLEAMAGGTLAHACDFDEYCMIEWYATQYNFDGLMYWGICLN